MPLGDFPSMIDFVAIDGRFAVRNVLVERNRPFRVSGLAFVDGIIAVGLLLNGIVDRVRIVVRSVGRLFVRRFGVV